MKNAIFFYYNLNPITITKRDKRYEFQLQNAWYVLTPCTRPQEELDKLYNLSIVLYERGIPVHQIVLNKDNQLVTFINQTPYILFHIYVPKDTNIVLNDILNFQKYTTTVSLDNLPVADWYHLWTQKIDYLEYQVSEFGKKYPMIRESFSYYVGIAENCISLVGMIPDIQKNTLSHRRLGVQSTLFDLYNPLNLVVDSKVRDICEFIKDSFFHGIHAIEQINFYFSTQALDKQEAKLFFIRMLFPSYYFDKYEQIIEKDHDEKELLPFIHHTKEFEYFISIIYQHLVQYAELPEIYWIKK
ncbi:MAG: hypothetical protein KH135_05820 [Firmicutes bacterium]|nr:hypothetical protein [Bacillota bacterium]